MSRRRRGRGHPMTRVPRAPRTVMKHLTLIALLAVSLTPARGSRPGFRPALRNRRLLGPAAAFAGLRQRRRCPPRRDLGAIRGLGEAPLPGPRLRPAHGTPPSRLRGNERSPGLGGPRRQHRASRRLLRKRPRLRARGRLCHADLRAPRGRLRDAGSPAGGMLRGRRLRRPQHLHNRDLCKRHLHSGARRRGLLPAGDLVRRLRREPRGFRA